MRSQLLDPTSFTIASSRLNMRPRLLLIMVLCQIGILCDVRWVKQHWQNLEKPVNFDSSDVDLQEPRSILL